MMLPIFKVGDYAYDHVTKSVVIIELSEKYAETFRYLVRNDDMGGFRFQEQLYFATKDLKGNPLPTTNEA